MEIRQNSISILWGVSPSDLSRWPVLNCLDIHDDMKFIDELRFNTGTGQLHYYIQNLQLKCNPSDIGIILV